MESNWNDKTRRDQREVFVIQVSSGVESALRKLTFRYCPWTLSTLRMVRKAPVISMVLCQSVARTQTVETDGLHSACMISLPQSTFHQVHWSCARGPRVFEYCWCILHCAHSYLPFSICFLHKAWWILFFLICWQMWLLCHAIESSLQTKKWVQHWINY